MLKDITSQIKTNGFLSEEIIIEREVRQGNPLSALSHFYRTKNEGGSGRPPHSFENR